MTLEHQLIAHFIPLMEEYQDYKVGKLSKKIMDFVDNLYKRPYYSIDQQRTE